MMAEDKQRELTQAELEQHDVVELPMREAMTLVSTQPIISPDPVLVESMPDQAPMEESPSLYHRPMYHTQGTTDVEPSA